MSRDEAIRIARAAAESEGWGWLEPVSADYRAASPQGAVWEVESNILSCGANVRILLDDATGAILEKAHLPR
jgi:hypothetical protein